MQKVTAIGNLGRDPETRYTQGGTAVTNWSIAVSEKWKDKQSGEMREETEWINCVAFNRLAEIAAEYLRKGSKVYIEGKMKTRMWEQDGIKRYKTEINVRELEMLSKKTESGGFSNSQPPAMPAAEDFDDDIPF